MKHLQIFFFLFMVFIGNAQTTKFPEYYVYLLKGNVTLSASNGKSEKIKLNQYLYEDGVLTIASNSEITLLNKEAKLLVLNTSGTFAVKNLANKFNNSTSSITKSYLKLLFDELLDPDYDYSKFQQKNLGGIRGGVSRGEGCGNLIFPVKDLKTSKDSILFKWHQTSMDGYHFLIYDKDGNEAVNMIMKDTQIVIDASKLLKGTIGKYYWVIKGKDANACEDDAIGFELMNKDDEQKLIPSLTLLKGSKDLLAQLQVIDELENNNWIYAASDLYATVLQANPDNIPLLKSYVLFLLNYGFNEEAEAIWRNKQVKH
jgi:hypothetical protein